MKLILDEKVINLQNQLTSVSEIFMHIKNHLDETEKKFSHMEFDGEEIYEDFEEVIIERLSNLEVLEVVFVTLNELLNDLYHTGESYLKRALPEIRKTFDLFYQGSTEMAWTNMEQILIALNWVNQLVDSIDKLDHKPSNWEEYVVAITTIRNELPQLEDGIKAKDSTLIADILNYEIVPGLEALKQALTKSIDLEGERKNAN
ncbi:hypothetical protein Pryu01_00693 [Paraliobacillus ryukyuensis]|uniref:Uncharacterized protein n=1 Tax=Paraliobacillus ryukyuensis TaxID=200904 RepID=A0A366EEI2_9BACI|nr:hypothetical protein [Paraliobacillus ryukyuensis]RBP00733.1 hypothetical protein DES48_102501 [Paraliobacillus ryukyuensis]